MSIQPYQFDPTLPRYRNAACAYGGIAFRSFRDLSPEVQLSAVIAHLRDRFLIDVAGTSDEDTDDIGTKLRREVLEELAAYDQEIGL